MAYVIALAIFFSLCCSSPIQAQRRAGYSTKLIDGLVSAPVLVTYVEDGAADASVTNVDVNSSREEVVDNPIPSVRDIVNLGPRSIAMLISHLDDTRATAANLCAYFPAGEKRCVPVPVGYVVEDILINIVRAPKFFVAECGDDGFGACVERGYYFRPDAYLRKGSNFVARPEVYRVKANWQRAYRRGEIKYQYPEWWKRRI